eukprot:4830518-Prymnesium_polylepis.1
MPVQRPRLGTLHLASGGGKRKSELRPGQDEPIGVQRKKQRDALYEPEMRAAISWIGTAIAEAMSGNLLGPGLSLCVRFGAWEALVSHCLSPCAAVSEGQQIELGRSELLELFDITQLQARQCIPGTKRRYVCRRASLSWVSAPPRNLPLTQAMAYGMEPEHQGELTIKLKVKIVDSDDGENAASG